MKKKVLYLVTWLTALAAILAITVILGVKIISRGDRSLTNPSWSQSETTRKALLIGSADVCLLRELASLPCADYFCDPGMTVYNARQISLPDESSPAVTLERLLYHGEYSQVFICLEAQGVKDPNGFLDAYWDLVTTIVQTQPQAKIYVQGVSNMECDREISRIADNYRIFYISSFRINRQEDSNAGKRTGPSAGPHYIARPGSLGT